jgi:hypothetical protein
MSKLRNPLADGIAAMNLTPREHAILDAGDQRIRQIRAQLSVTRRDDPLRRKLEQQLADEQNAQAARMRDLQQRKEP